VSAPRLVVEAHGAVCRASDEEASSMTCLRVVCALLALAYLALLPVAAQDKAGPEQAYLQHFVGEWEATASFGGGTSKGVEKNRLEGGLWLISDFTGEFGGQKFTGHGVQGYDKNKKKFVGIWVDSMEPSIMHYEGTLDSSGKVLTTIGEGTMEGQPTKMKMVTEITDKDTHVFKMFMDVNAKEPQMTITYKRKK
jgi:hypothetical protein